MDRNQQKVASFRERQRQMQLEHAAASGRLAALDILGRPIEANDLIHVSALPNAQIFRVVEVEPILADPQLAGMIRLRAECVFEIALRAGVQNGGMAVILPVGAVEDIAAGAGDGAGTASEPPRVQLTD